MSTCQTCSAEIPETAKFCPECGAALAPGLQPTVQHVEAEEKNSGSSRSDSSGHGRFLPGAKIVGRYRIVSLLGKGGMGEVYRADDLKLGHAVALKFLPKELARDQKRLDYFHSEVRLSRQVSHPNVCRVYDIAEVDGQHFLSMEYIDGEDLKGLLRRIGRLPKDKGIEIARQLCAGLAAAHDKGVLHRDLKPANIMIDGRGQVRITDFGLAQLAADDGDPDEIAGTPAYMAPEQLLRGQTSIQSDLYSLGLILYEMFTGKPVHKAASLAELRDSHVQSTSTPSPSEVVDDMDPVVERVILRCLEKEAHERPKSVAVVAGALPGGDPLAAAIAAGETPSPEMVAAAGDVGGLSPAVGGACLAGVAVCLFVACLLADRTYLVNRAPLERSPQSLEDEAEEIIRHLGYDDVSADTAIGFVDMPTDLQLIEQSEITDGVKDRWDLLQTGHWPGIRFWYRQSPQEMLVEAYWSEDRFRFSRTRVSLRHPPWRVPGMVGVRLDPQGKLRWLRAVPSMNTMARSAQDVTELKWSEWFPEEYLGFDLDDLSLADWQRTPPDAFDTLQAWEGTWPDSDESLCVEAAAYRGRPVYFEILRPSETKESAYASLIATPSVEFDRIQFLFGSSD